MTLYLGYALLGFLCGYALCHSRRPACQREHLPRHLDPAIVNRESDEGVQPPDPRTWPGTPTSDGARTWPSATLTAWTLPPPTVYSTGGNAGPGHVLHPDRASDCPDCEALRVAMRRPPSGP